MNWFTSESEYEFSDFVSWNQQHIINVERKQINNKKRQTKNDNCRWRDFSPSSSSSVRSFVFKFAMRFVGIFGEASNHCLWLFFIEFFISHLLTIRYQRQWTEEKKKLKPKEANKNWQLIRHFNDTIFFRYLFLRCPPSLSLFSIIRNLFAYFCLCCLSKIKSKIFHFAINNLLLKRYSLLSFQR